MKLNSWIYKGLFFACCFFLTSSLSAQCSLSIPDSLDYIGNTTLMTSHLSQAEITIEKIDASHYRVSDLSCGLFKKFDNQSIFPVVLSFDCLAVESQIIESDYGPIEITGGAWNSGNNTLEIDWSNDFNDITETSVITLN